MQKHYHITEIDFEGHGLAGVDTVEYIYDPREKTLVINADGIELNEYKGIEAFEIFKQVSED